MEMMMIATIMGITLLVSCIVGFCIGMAIGACFSCQNASDGPAPYYNHRSGT